MSHLSNVVCVSLEEAVEELESSFNTPFGDRDPNWPHIWCRISRLIHIAVWDECPEPEYTKKIIDLLTKARDQMHSLDKEVYSEDEQKRIEKHTRNITCRIKNIRDNYSHGKKSEFEPDDPLD